MTEEFNRYATALNTRKLFEMDTLYQEHLNDYIPAFQAHFNKTCETICRLQKKNEIGEISYLEYTFLHTNLIQKNETAEVRVYNKDWYFDPAQRAVGSFDYSFVFTKYRELWNELMTSRKRFAGAVTAQETISFLLTCASIYYRYVASIFRYSILPCVETEPFLSVRRADEFEINVGEYMAYTEAVYKENHTRTSADALDWFRLREEFVYAFEDFSGLDFSGADLSEIDLRYADLRRADLTGTDFQDSLLYGTRFCHASLRGADLRYCQIHEADFSGADLTDARLNTTTGYQGVPDKENWTLTGFRPINFRNANLTRADFCRSKIRDADFTGAVMDGTRMNRRQLEQFTLSFQQKQAIQIMDL